MTTLIIVIVVVALASAGAAFMQKRQPDVPSAPQFGVPQQVDRTDFEHPDTSWLLILFSSQTCLSCIDARKTLSAVRANDVAVQDVPVESHKGTHDRYSVNAVPMVLLADAEGVVAWSYLGAPPNDAIAELLNDIGVVPPETGTAVDL